MPGPSDEKDGKDEMAGAPVVRFPQSRVRPPGGIEPYKELGVGRMALALGVRNEQLTGRWCSRCKGVWFGYLLEVECPKCGNRNG